MKDFIPYPSILCYDQKKKGLILKQTFIDLATASIMEETTLCATDFLEQTAENHDFSALEIRDAILEDCGFAQSNFANASFWNCTFRQCNFSNVNFADAYFSGCAFIGCKLVGVDFTGAIMKDTKLENSNCSYANFFRVSLDRLDLAKTDFRESSFGEAKFRRVIASECRFISNYFHHADLGCTDFSSCEFAAPTLSDPPTELKGITVNALQASDLAELMGLRVKEH